MILQIIPGTPLSASWFGSGERVVINPPTGHYGNNFTAALPLIYPTATTFCIANNSSGALWFQFGATNVIPTGPNVNGCIRVEGEQFVFVLDDGNATRIGITLSAPWGSVTVTSGGGTGATMNIGGFLPNTKPWVNPELEALRQASRQAAEGTV
jgi:hypothetical protein